MKDREKEGGEESNGDGGAGGGGGGYEQHGKGWGKRNNKGVKRN